MADLFVPEEPIPNSRDSGIGGNDITPPLDTTPLEKSIQECKRQIQIFESDLESLRNSKV